MLYAADVKTARMTVVRDQLDAGAAAGKLEIGTSAMAAVLATVTLNDPSATITGDVLTASGFPKTVAASGTGKALAARFRDSDNADVITDLSVGLTLTAAPTWVGSTAYALNDYRTNGANIYKCVTAGTSAASGGPTGTGTAITDGTAVWDWYCVAGANIQLDALDITTGQNVTLNSATITHAA